MFGQIDILLAQSNEDQEVMRNLEQTDTELQQLDQRFDQIVNAYESSQRFGWDSFFRMDNIYFWIVITGLVLLAIGLGLLLAELKKERQPEAKAEKRAKVADDRGSFHALYGTAPKTEQAAQKTDGPIKIKVIKKK